MSQTIHISGVLLVLNIAILVLSSSVFTVANANNIYRESTGSLAPGLAYRPPELTPPLAGPIYVYLIFLSAFSCVFLIPMYVPISSPPSSGC